MKLPDEYFELTEEEKRAFIEGSTELERQAQHEAWVDAQGFSEDGRALALQFKPGDRIHVGERLFYVVGITGVPREEAVALDEDPREWTLLVSDLNPAIDVDAATSEDHLYVIPRKVVDQLTKMKGTQS